MLVVLAGCLATSGTSDSPPPTNPTPIPRTLGEALSGARLETGAPGAAAAIVRDGTMVFEGASGDAAREPLRQLRTSSLFSLVGVTEMATAVMVLRLAEQGRVTLEDPLARYVPYVPGADRISVRMLLAHRAGLPDYLSQSVRFGEIGPALADPVHPWTREEVLRAIHPDDIDRTPGQYFYSSTDYVALGAVIELATRGGVDAYFKQLVATPLGLDRCLFDRDPALAPDVAHGFVFDNAKREYRSIFPPSGVVPTLIWGPVWTDNGIACSPRDTARFVDALLRGQLVRAETLALMTTFGAENYGLGVARTTGEEGARLGHAGARAGYGAAAWFDPERRVTIVALTNADGPSFLAGTVHQRMEEAYTRGATP
jgi:D-alanyl-D-alanine carboxypeptidase